MGVLKASFYLVATLLVVDVSSWDLHEYRQLHRRFHIDRDHLLQPIWPLEGSRERIKGQGTLKHIFKESGEDESHNEGSGVEQIDEPKIGDEESKKSQLWEEELWRNERRRRHHKHGSSEENRESEVDESHERHRRKHHDRKSEEESQKDSKRKDEVDDERHRRKHKLNDTRSDESNKSNEEDERNKGKEDSNESHEKHHKKDRRHRERSREEEKNRRERHRHHHRHSKDKNGSEESASKESKFKESESKESESKESKSNESESKESKSKENGSTESKSKENESTDSNTVSKESKETENKVSDGSQPNENTENFIGNKNSAASSEKDTSDGKERESPEKPSESLPGSKDSEGPSVDVNVSPSIPDSNKPTLSSLGTQNGDVKPDNSATNSGLQPVNPSVTTSTSLEQNSKVSPSINANSQSTPVPEIEAGITSKSEAGNQIPLQTTNPGVGGTISSNRQSSVTSQSGVSQSVQDSTEDPKRFSQPPTSKSDLGSKGTGSSSEQSEVSISQAPKLSTSTSTLNPVSVGSETDLEIPKLEEENESTLSDVPKSSFDQGLSQTPKVSTTEVGSVSGSSQAPGSVRDVTKISGATTDSPSNSSSQVGPSQQTKDVTIPPSTSKPRESMDDDYLTKVSSASSIPEGTTIEEIEVTSEITGTSSSTKRPVTDIPLITEINDSQSPTVQSERTSRIPNFDILTTVINKLNSPSRGTADPQKTSSFEENVTITNRQTTQSTATEADATRTRESQVSEQANISSIPPDNVDATDLPDDLIVDNGSSTDNRREVREATATTTTVPPSTMAPGKVVEEPWEECKTVGFQCANCHVSMACVYNGTSFVPFTKMCPPGTFCNKGQCRIQSFCSNPSFTCHDEGYFPDPTNCKVYYGCSRIGNDFRRIKYKCENNGFDLRSMSCSLPEASNACQQRPVPECHVSRQVGIVGNDPGTFYICILEGKMLTPRMYKCPVGMRFNPPSFSCVI